MSEVWFPAKESQRVVGRIIEIEKAHGERSRQERRPVHIMVPVMASKVAGEHDISHQEIKDWNRDAICGRFPGAWEEYQKRSEPKAAGAELPAVAGLPLERAEFIQRDKIAWLKLQGFSTVEQLADLTDAQVQALGRGAAQWRKKAVTLLRDAAGKA